MIVKVDIDQIKHLATKIDQYISAHRQNMTALNANMATVCARVVGKEFDEFRQKWSSINGPTSTSEKMLSCLKSYASFLRSCAEYYDRIQENSKNRYMRL